VERLLHEKKLGGKAISKLSLQDVVAPAEPREKPFEISARTGDLSVPGEAGALVAGNPDVIFHLAAIVSGEAETDFEKGYRINLDGTRFLYDARRSMARSATTFT
jgi:nucleoside-diphosphate-sugar epimerase